MTFSPRKSFVLRVDREQDDKGRPTFDLSLLLVKTRRVHGFLEHRVVKDTPQLVTHTEEAALRSFLDLRDRIAEVGFPEFVGGHILGPLSAYAVEHGVPESGLTVGGEERHDREVRKRGEPILK